ncbi:uncharacterized protein LOC115313831 isoform X2 [Ixodes scapularis]|uniref:uncharacterized protein LOC115313831 isoform X2 n=1 Tax=Ixodes scapularis TaxID=6945 RepID=UPI001A9D3090|nr:uncharacterized protein LOC115313831 isoform X2 [Ixodes scapularis]
MSEPVATAEEARPNVDLELEQRVKGSCGRISENAHIFANEPSLACYRLQEHVRRSLGAAVERRLQLAEARHELRGTAQERGVRQAAAGAWGGAAAGQEAITSATPVRLLRPGCRSAGTRFCRRPEQFAVPGIGHAHLPPSSHPALGQCLPEEAEGCVSVIRRTLHVIGQS